MKKAQNTTRKEFENSEKKSQVRNELINLLQSSGTIYENNKYLEKLIEYISFAVSNYRKLVESKLEKDDPSSKGEERKAIKFFRTENNDHEILYIDRLMNKFTERQELFKECIKTSEEIENLNEENKNIDGYDIEFLNEVNTPPDEMDEKFFTGGEYEESEGENQERLASILFLLKKKGIKEKDIKIYFGKNEENMMRDETYKTIYLKKLEKLIFVCNEYGNATFVMDRDSKKEVIDYIRMTKNEKHEEGAKWIKRNEDLGKWLSEVEDSVFGEINLIKEEKKLKQVEKDNDIPKVAKEGEWKGFWTDEEGKHWGAKKTITKRLNISKSKISVVVEGMLSKRIKDINGRKIDAYCIEEIITILEGYILLARVAKNGEWKGFWEDEEGKHWGTKHAIMNKLDIGKNTLKSVMDGLLFIKIRDSKGCEENGYCYEDIYENLKEYLLLRQADKEGKWKDCWTDEDGQHWCSIGTIVRKFGIHIKKIKSVIKIKKMTHQLIRLNSGGEVKAYCYEEIYNELKDYLSLPQVAKSSEWKGFWTDEEGRHWGTKYAIMKKLNIGKGSVGKMLKKASHINIRDMIGHEKNGYCYEDIYIENRDNILLPKVAKEGYWKGFWQDKDGKNWGAIGTIVKKYNIHIDIIKRAVKDSIPKKMRDVGGRIIDSYCYEDIVEKMKTKNNN